MINSSHSDNLLFGLLYKALLALTLLYLVLSPFLNQMELYILRFPSLLIIIVMALLYSRYHKYNIWELSALFSLIGIIVLNYILYEIPPEPDTLYRTAGFLSFVMLIMVSDAITLTPKMISFTYVISICTTLVLFAYSFSSFSHWDTHQYVENLTLGFYNPNFTSMILFLLYSIIFICMPRKYKWFSWLCEGILCYLIYQTHSRTTLLVALFLPLVSVFIKNKPFPRWFVLSFCAIPFLFVKIYIDLYQRFGSGGTFLGKPLFSGREKLFAEKLHQIYDLVHYLIGHAEDSIFENFHNAPLSVFISIGILGSICFYGIILKRLFLYNKHTNNFISSCAILVLLVAFVHSAAEAGTFLGGYPMPVFMFVFFVLAHYKLEPREHL